MSAPAVGGDGARAVEAAGGIDAAVVAHAVDHRHDGDRQVALTPRQFALLERELSVEEDELTPTMKLKRKPIGEKYGAEIETLYEG